MALVLIGTVAYVASVRQRTLEDLLMKVVAMGLVAIVFSLATVLAGAALQTGAWPSGPDAMGFAMATAVAGILLMVVVHWPVLARLRRRAGVLSPWRAAIVAALVLNAPVYVGLAVVGQNRSVFAGGETFLVGVAFAVLGLVFGAGYAHTHREAAA